MARPTSGTQCVALFIVRLRAAHVHVACLFVLKRQENVLLNERWVCVRTAPSIQAHRRAVMLRFEEHTSSAHSF